MLRDLKSPKPYQNPKSMENICLWAICRCLEAITVPTWGDQVSSYKVFWWSLCLRMTRASGGVDRGYIGLTRVLG